MPPFLLYSGGIKCHRHCQPLLPMSIVSQQRSRTGLTGLTCGHRLSAPMVCLFAIFEHKLSIFALTSVQVILSFDSSIKTSSLMATRNGTALTGLSAGGSQADLEPIIAPLVPPLLAEIYVALLALLPH